MTGELVITCLPAIIQSLAGRGIAGMAGGAGKAGICLSVITKLSSRVMTGVGGALGQMTG